MHTTTVSKNELQEKSTIFPVSRIIIQGIQHFFITRNLKKRNLYATHDSSIPIRHNIVFIQNCEFNIVRHIQDVELKIAIPARRKASGYYLGTNYMVS